MESFANDPMALDLKAEKQKLLPFTAVRLQDGESSTLEVALSKWLTRQRAAAEGRANRSEGDWHQQFANESNSSNAHKKSLQANALVA